MQTEAVMDYVPLAGMVINLVLVLVILPLRNSVDKLSASDEQMRREMAEARIEMARDYVRRTDLDSSLSDIRLALERIERRMYDRVEALEHGKVDKPS